MKALRYHRLLLFAWLLSSLAWGQTAPTLPGESSPSATRQSDGRMAVNPSGTYRAPRQIQPQTPQRRLREQPSGQPIPNRVQVPNRAQPTTPVLIFFSAVVGAVLFMGLFTVAQFLLNRDAPYGWYALYLLVTATWLWQSTRVGLNGAAPADQPPPPAQPVFLACMLLLKYVMIVSYIRFVGHLLEVPRQQPRLDRWTRYYVRFFTLSVLVLLAELLIWRSVGPRSVGPLPGLPDHQRSGWAYVSIGIDVLTYAGLLFLIIGMLRIRHPLTRYVLIGFGLILSAAMTATFLKYTGLPTTDQLARMPLFYVAVTTLLEILCFSLALGRRFQINKDETIRTQQQLIWQLEANRQLQQTHGLELARTLAQREAEVLTKAHELEEQRISQLQSDFVRQLAEAEMAGLRSQMNPHFIFNCLNSIKLYATENESEKASEYLTKFSRLIRLVLENSRSERVTLQNELDALRLYLDMEAMRFKNKLRFEVLVAPEVDADFTEIPPLLIQPYVENAIWHGLMHKAEGGTVSISLELPEPDRLRVTVADDGVGRAQAAELKSKSATPKKSFGLKVTGERIALINQLYQTHTRVQIHDLVGADGHPAGTEVVLEIPI